jgi:hypothetical protein
MRIRLAVPERHVSPEILNAALEAVTRGNEAMLVAGEVPLATDLIASGFRWKPEPYSDGEHFDLGEEIVRRGWGDCDDWAPHHAASLRVTGEDPGATAIVKRSGPKKWHAVVRRSDGTIDDPSRWAGMGQRAGRAIRGAVHRSLVAGAPVLATMPYGGRYAARCDIPWRGSSISVSGVALAGDELDAASQAIEAACHVAGASGVSDPDDVARFEAWRALGSMGPDDVRALLRDSGFSSVVGELEEVGMFGALGDVLKAAAPIASVVPGIGPLAGMAAGLAGNMLSPSGGGAPAPAAAPAAPAGGGVPGGGWGGGGGGGQPTVYNPGGGSPGPIIIRF